MLARRQSHVTGRRLKLTRLRRGGGGGHLFKAGRGKRRQRLRRREGEGLEQRQVERELLYTVHTEMQVEAGLHNIGRHTVHQFMNESLYMSSCGIPWNRVFYLSSEGCWLYNDTKR